MQLGVSHNLWRDTKDKETYTDLNDDTGPDAVDHFITQSAIPCRTLGR